MKMKYKIGTLVQIANANGTEYGEVEAIITTKDTMKYRVNSRDVFEKEILASWIPEKKMIKSLVKKPRTKKTAIEQATAQ